MGNSFGNIFKITTFGESHGPAIGVIIDGCPALIDWDEELLLTDMARRKPGQSRLTTRRDEADQPKVLSGVFEGKTTGAPIAIMIENQDQRSKDYSHIAQSFRPSHADYTYQAKYGIRDYRGGGRSSARETAARVAAGAVAKMFLNTLNVQVQAYVHSVADIALNIHPLSTDLSAVEDNLVRCPDADVAEKMASAIDNARKNGDTLGGTIYCRILGAQPGWGEPVFDRLNATLAHAILSINAAKAIEFGSGFEGTLLKGSEHNDTFTTDQSGQIVTTTNRSGGIQGGITNGMPIYFKVAFKPVATILRPQQSVDNEGNSTVVEGKGRHDPCVLPRAVPIVEAMAAIAVADAALMARTNKAIF